MSRYLFDIETDNLLDKCTRCWIVFLLDIDTGHKYYYLEGDLGWKEKLRNADLVIGHNIIGFDLLALLKLFDFNLPKSCRIHDTMIMSQVLDYKRFGEAGHSLKVWGEYLNFPKGDFTDFSQYTLEMLAYCEQDVDLNYEVYEVLIAEFQGLVAVNDRLIAYMRAEHAIAKWSATANWIGWPFDFEEGINLFSEMSGKLFDTTQILESKLGIKAVATDKVKDVVDVKKPKWKKDGNYNSHTCSWFSVKEEEGQEDASRPIAGEYCRVEFKALKLSSTNDVKIFLYRNGWVPNEYNYKFNPVTYEKIRMSPKITDDSLEFLGGDGKLYTEYRSISSRYSILKNWLDNVGEDGRLRGDCFTIGTPSMRARHKIIVNVPSEDSLYGPEMRRLFKCLPGWKLIGCDSAGNQARGLAHYLNNDEFTNILLNDDIHTYNAGKLDNVLRSMGINWGDYLKLQGVVADEEHTLEEAIAAAKRRAAKRILYAFLFGASGGKLWGYIFGNQNDKKGNTLKLGFTKAVPGFKDLLTRLGNVYGQTMKSNKGKGFIPSAAGTRIYVDSKHKLLVYLLQSLEKITCSGACLLLMQYLEEEKIPYMPAIFMHDELQLAVPEEFAERVAELGKKAFQEGPKLFGVTIMDGEGKVGNNWYDTH